MYYSSHINNCHNREVIFSKLAPELFPTILPSVEYLAEDVPVPIPSSDSEYVKLCVHVCMHVFMCDLQKCIMYIYRAKTRNLRSSINNF